MTYESTGEPASCLPKREQDLQSCRAWVEQHLPPGLPPSARRAALKNMATGLDGKFLRSMIQKYQTGEISDRDLEELRFQMFRSACREAASTVASHEGMDEANRWRYHLWRSENGQDLYKENLEYQFDAIYDMRKLWFEFQLQLERAVLPPRRVAEQAEYYENCLNNRFRTPHWRWDPGTFTFVEISHSRLVDGRGVEQPNEKTLRGLLDRFER